MAARIDNEGDVKKQVKKLLDAHRWFWWMPGANGFGKTGVSDFCALRNGVFLGVETKFGKNKPTTRQVAFLQSVNVENGIGLVVNEKTLDTFHQWLELFDQSTDYTARGEKPPAEVCF